MYKGSMVALITPMKPDGELDRKALERLVQFHLEQGTEAIISVGTTGESATLSVEEHCQVIDWTVSIVSGQIPVIAGSGANCTREAIFLTKKAKQLGADGCLSVTPYYNKPTQEGLYQHYKAIAEAVDIPIILYNVPGRTCCDILPETTARLSQISNIVGIKDATADMGRLAQELKYCGNDFVILSGDDATSRDFMLQGGHGVISVTANVAPKAIAELCEAALRRDELAAQQIDEPLTKLHKALFVESNPIPVKWALYKMGYIEQGIRLPMTWLTKEAEKKIEEALITAGCLK